MNISLTKSVPDSRQPVHGFVVVKTRSRSPDKRFFASSQDDLLKAVAESSEMSLSQEVMLGARKICEATATPRQAFSFREDNS